MYSSINLNNASNDCGSPSIEIHNISMSNITLNNHLDSGNIATRVWARNEIARKITVHKKSQHFKARNPGNTSSSESLSYMNINPKGNKFTIHINVNDRCRSSRSRFLHFLFFK